MRQYRGLTKDGKWVYGYLLEFKDMSIIFERGESILISKASCKPLSYISSDFWTEVIPETVGQSAGLKDKNDKDLDWWEDDLLCKGSYHSCAPIGRIIYSTQKAKWVIVSQSGGEFCGLIQAYNNGWEKIGNIHQNPELLEKPK